MPTWNFRKTFFHHPVHHQIRYRTGCIGNGWQRVNHVTHRRGFHNEHLHAHTLRNALSTCAGSSFSRQSRCCRGHWRLKQGEQAMPVRTIAARFDNGGVNCGEEEPYTATKGRSSAAVMCINPESLVTTAL